MSDHYLDDLKPGESFTSPSTTLTKDDIVAFARVYDPQPFHLDEDAAARSHFGELVAGGFQTASLAWALAQKTGVFASCSIAGLGIDRVLRWRKPVRASDTLRCQFELLSKRASVSQSNRGIAVWRFDVLNQDDQIVLTMRMRQLLKCRDDDR